MSKLQKLVVFGAGYVLGAQAGRGRYEQIKLQATRVAAHPRPQALVQRVREEAQTRLPSAAGSRLGGGNGAGGVGYLPGGHVSRPERDSVIDLSDRVDADRPGGSPGHL